MPNDAIFEDLFKEGYRKKYQLNPRLIDLNRHAKVRDEIVSVFISAMMGHIVKSWEALPCITKPIEPCLTAEENKMDAESSTFDVSTGIEEQRESSIAHLEETLKRSSIGKKKKKRGERESSKSLFSAKLSTTVESQFSREEKESFKDKSISFMVPSYASEWVAVSTDPSVLIEDWRFYEGDQIAIIEFKNGNKYRGRLSRNVMHGEGEFFWANGTVYRGNFNCGDIVGKGTIYWPDLSWYDGDLFHGYRHGKGLLVLPELLAYYGDWVQGIRHGKGLLVYDTDLLRNCYDVTWKRGICSGNGLRVYPNSAQYDGQWKNGLQHGHGVMIWANGDVYIGDWANGKMEGVGKYLWYAFMTNDFVTPARNSYYGTWVDNKKDGVGILETVSGVCIKGEWKDDLKHGYGEIICRNGILITQNPLFVNDHLTLLKFNDNHPWAFMMKLDNMNIIKHNAGYAFTEKDTVTENKKSKPCGSKDLILNVKTENVIQDSSVENKILKFNPTTLSSEYVDLSYHLIRLSKKKEKSKNFEANNEKNETKLFDELKGSLLKLPINRSSLESIKKSVDYDSNEPLQFYSFESKWVRNVILRHLPYLKKLYNDYAAMLCYNRPNYAVQLPRLLLWQMFRDFNIQKKGVVLYNIDQRMKLNPTSMVEDVRSPFEKLKFFQFIHYLIELSWEMYGKYDIGIYETPGILASAFEKLIEDDIKPNARNHNGISLLIYRDLLPLNELYNKFYCLYNMNTIRKFLTLVLNLEPKYNILSQFKEPEIEETSLSYPDINYSQLKNIYDVGDQPNYKFMKTNTWKQITCEEYLITVDPSEIDYEKMIEEHGESTTKPISVAQFLFCEERGNFDKPETGDDPLQEIKDDDSKCTPSFADTSINKGNTATFSKFSQSGNDEKTTHSNSDESDINRYSLTNVTIKTIMECIQEVCPYTKANGLLVNTDCKITFLEFYEMLILCSIKSIKNDTALREKRNSTKIVTSEVKGTENTSISLSEGKTANRKNITSSKKK